MECSQVRLKLDDYISNRLGKVIKEDIDFHLKECQQCFEEMNILKELNEFLNVERPAYPNEIFTSSIMDRIEKERVKSKSFIFNKLPIINFGASLVLTGLLIIFVNIPYINGAIKSCSDRVQYSAATINTSISSTTHSVETYVTSILNFGREVK